MKITHSPNEKGIYPLSSSQSRIWFMENLDRNITAYNIPLDYKITGDLDLHALNKAINVLIEGHSSFRTIFPDGDGNPVQKILPKVSFSINVINLEHETKERQKELVSELSCANSMRKFDLKNGPLFYFELLKLAPEEHVFLINFHHIISDATSVAIFMDELKETYQAIKEKRTINIPSEAFTYADYAMWEAKWVKTDEYQAQLDYWKEELQGIPELLQLPFDFQRPRMQTYQGNEFHFRIDETLRKKLTAISKKHNTSLFVTMLAGFGVLLSRYSLQDDIVIGVPVANRLREELESMIGILINSLPIRIPVTEKSNFYDVIETSKHKFLKAYDNQDVAFERLVEELKLKRNTSVSPIFQVQFNFLTTYQKEMKLSDLTVQMLDGERRASQVDITMSIHDQNSDMHGIIEYNTDLFNRDTIERMSGHFITLLDEMAEKECVPVRRLPILTKNEYNLIVNEWNKTDVYYPRDKCVHNIVEWQVDKTPDAIAVTDDTESITYKELNKRANRLAHYLVKKGATEGTFVATYIERGINMVVGMLAISKTGATLMPMDPIFPKDRIEVMLLDAKPPIILTQTSLNDDLPETTAPRIYIDKTSEYEDEPEDNMSYGNPDEAAYMLYTSGSTGKPKGVMVKQNSTVNIVFAMGRKMKVTADDILLSSTTVTFDVFEMEIYLPLFHGAKLVMASQTTSIDIDLLKDKIEKSNATLFLATPVTFKMLVMSHWKGKHDMRVLCGGEGLSKELAREMLKRVGEVWNGMAPTETTIYSLARKVTMEDTMGEGYVTLGYPLDNNRIYILNSDRVPVPIGIPGELYIGGEAVSNGYLNRPDLNKAAFLPDPFSGKLGAIMYKTGDLVHYTPKGNVIFLSRVDFQVKIRGFRIELGEIESNITLFGGIKQNVVVVRNDHTGEKMLVGYYIPEPGKKVNLQDLRSFLKSKLPEYMVPAVFVEMEKFPLTDTLKINRKALPEPEATIIEGKEKYVEPSTATEKKLARIWCSILNLKKVGVNDDFFEIGGHSMIAVSLMVRIEKELDIRLPLATLFERSTIAQLAELIDIKPENLRWRSLVPIRPEGNKKPLFLIHGMGLNVLLYTTVVNYLDPDQPVYGLQAKGLNGKDEPLDRIEDISAYYISEMMTVDSEGPYAMAGFSLGGRIAYEMARQLVAMGKEISFLGVFDATADDSFEDLPLAQKLPKKLNRALRYTIWNIGSFFKENDDKMTVIARKWRGLEKKIRGYDFNVVDDTVVSHGKRSELPKYMRKVHRANSKADKQYVIKPYPGSVHLFKAQKQTFYLESPETYGWDRVAKGGVFVHVIPGEHSNTFAPPNDKYFANVLQQSLNDSNYQTN